MPIPPFEASSVEKALEELLPEVGEIKASNHNSTKYDLLWRGHRFPPKVVVRKAVEIEHGINLPESEFSGGTHAGQANAVLQALGFVIVPKDSSGVLLPLELFGRYGRKDAFASVGIKYDPKKQRHLNVGLSPRCRDNGYLIFITLNKEDLDPAHDYADELFAEQLTWITRRDATEGQQDYVNLRRPETRVSLFVRTRPHENFVYAGEMEYEEFKSFKDPSSGRPQMRYVWRLKNRIPDALLQELTFGLAKTRTKPHSASKKNSRAPSSFDELKKAYSYVLGTAETIVVPEHQNYQVRLTKFLADRGVRAEMEKDFVDVSFSAGGQDFIGEIKVTRNLTLAQAFRAALGQLLDYGDLLQKPPALIMFLDQALDQRRLKLASMLKIAVVVPEGEQFVLLNLDGATPQLKTVFKD
jgi:hypothetical protein